MALPNWRSIRSGKRSGCPLVRGKCPGVSGFCFRQIDMRPVLGQNENVVCRGARSGGEDVMADLLKRITVDPAQCGGRPCIRGMRIRVTDVLDLLAEGLSSEELLSEMPDLEPDDIAAALQYAARKINHPVLAA